MIVCEVVVGNSYSTTSKMPHLTQAPSGYDSVKAEGPTDNIHSQFQVSALVYILYLVNARQIMCNLVGY